ncbi:MAG: hypothetical protein PHZ09_00215 [Eubacteriales bacterium]|jgi:uncharacterized membrane protein|nr:hypothetical protein [Eubacteriales bacterium]
MFKKRRLGVIAALTLVFFAAVYCAVTLTLRRLGDIMALFYKNDIVTGILGQLRAAAINPPRALLLVGGFICAVILYTAFIDRGKGTAKIKLMKPGAVIAVLLITISVYVSGIYLSVVNGVPFHLAAGIIGGIIESGVLG